MPTTKKIYNIGYQGRSIESFCQTLAAAGVSTLVDVRAAAWSQRPQYRKTALANALSVHGIEYIHCKIAGNPFRPRAGSDQTWQTCERLYSQHLDGRPEIVDALEELVLARPAALLCYEAQRSDCHRGVLLSRLIGRRPKVSVVDL